MVHNAKTLVRALLAPNKFTQISHLAKLMSGKEYTKSFLYTTRVLLECRDINFVNDTDRKDIEEH